MIFLNFKQNIILRAKFSDHFSDPIFLHLKDSEVSKLHQNTKERNFKQFDEEKFLDDLKAVKWRLSENTNVSCDNVLVDLNRIVDNHAPLIKKRV